MAYINYTITTPFVEMTPSTILPTTYTKVITPKVGFVVAAKDFSADVNAANYGISNVTFTDTTTEYNYDNEVTVTFTLPQYALNANGWPFSNGFLSFDEGGITNLSIPISGNAIKAENTWNGIVSITNNAHDSAVITTPGSMGDVAMSNGTKKFITASLTPDEFTKIFTVTFEADFQSGGVTIGPAFGGGTFTSGYWWYPTFSGFKITTTDIERYSVKRTNIEYDPNSPNRIYKFDLEVFCKSDKTISFFEFEKFESVRSLSMPGSVNSAPVADNTATATLIVNP